MRAIAACALLLLGCATTRPWQAPDQAPEDYATALRDWTRRSSTYDGMDGRAFAIVTWMSPRFAAARAAEHAARIGATAAEAEQMRTEAVAAAEAEARFFIALTTLDPYWNDLDKGDSLAARLEGDGQWQAPTRVHRLTNDEMADAKTFFPYADPLTVGYDVTFAQPTDRRRVRLRIAGAPARLDLEWETAP
ncbi:MAG: hypothetical protein KC620_18145 [Myxococcales bacterium]|nr:hypothetical protein [Myxococcales bacterium]